MISFLSETDPSGEIRELFFSDLFQGLFILTAPASDGSLKTMAGPGLIITRIYE